MAALDRIAPPSVTGFSGTQVPAEETAHAAYHRYHIETHAAHDRAPYPTRFLVKVNRLGLAKLLLSELIRYRRNPAVALSRPCVYGTFSGPVGGFAPRPQYCVGCLRCTMQHPDFVQVLPNPARLELGDAYFTPQQVEAVTYEAQTGKVPVKGAGYRGKFGGAGWDGMWTDMSEIVRPTRDGIHGREFISTAVDIGSRPAFLQFDEYGAVEGAAPGALTLPLPMLFDALPPAVASPALLGVLAEAARALETLFVVRLPALAGLPLENAALVPLVEPTEREALAALEFAPRAVEMAAWDYALYRAIGERFPGAARVLRVPYSADFEALLQAASAGGVRVFHLAADYHGHGADGRFVLDLIRRAHAHFVEKGYRDEVTLIGSGGIVAAEHVAKAILCGLDAVALDTPLLVALQARMLGQCADPAASRFSLPPLEPAWGVQRLKNLAASWRDQLLELMGAMGLREVRRMRGEMGRAMFQADLEREAFGGIAGYDR